MSKLVACLVVMTGIVVFVFGLAVFVWGCAGAAPSGAKLLQGNENILRCEELGRATYRSDAGNVAAFDTYFVCTQEAGLR